MVLTYRQLLFVAEYLKDLNATGAARRAGYSKKMARLTGHRMLRNDNIRKKICEEIDRALEGGRALLCYRVKAELEQIAFSRVTDYTDESGRILASALATVNPGAIREIVIETHGDETRITRIKLYDKMKALELLGRISGLLPNAGNAAGGNSLYIVPQPVKKLAG